LADSKNSVERDHATILKSFGIDISIYEIGRDILMDYSIKVEKEAGISPQETPEPNQNILLITITHIMLN